MTSADSLAAEAGPVARPAPSSRSSTTACSPTAAPPPRQPRRVDRWLCLPRFDSPSLFAPDPRSRAGHWSTRPQRAIAARPHVRGTLVLETTLHDRRPAPCACARGGSPRALGAMAHNLGLDPPRGPARAERRRRGRARARAAPRGEYGSRGRCSAAEPGGGRIVRRPATGSRRDAGGTRDGRGRTMRARFTLAAGEAVGFSLRWAPVEAPHPEPTEPGRVAARSATRWRRGALGGPPRHLRGPAPRARALLLRVLKGLSPAHGRRRGRPYDDRCRRPSEASATGHRSAWIRDRRPHARGALIGACSDEAENFVSFMRRGGRPARDYSSAAHVRHRRRADLTERELGHLRGWRDSAPCAGRQRAGASQLDVYGECSTRVPLPRTSRRAAPGDPRFVPTSPTPPPAAGANGTRGCWRCPRRAAHHLSSKVLCWTALDRAVKLADRLGDHARHADWSAARDEITRRRARARVEREAPGVRAAFDCRRARRRACC